MLAITKKEYLSSHQFDAAITLYPTTTINYAIASAGQVTLKVYHMLGREVAILVNEFKQPGNYQVNFNTSHVERSRDIPSVFYFLQAGSFSQTKKPVLMK